MNQSVAPAKVTLTPGILSEYDVIFIGDRSGSMSHPSTRFDGKTRWEEAQEFVQGLANFADKYDDDGLDVIFFNSQAEVHNGITGAKVAELFSSHEPFGTTNCAAALQIAVDMQKKSGKKTICIVVTDGAPNSQDAVADVIKNAANNLTVMEELSFQFIQIGDDKAAGIFLDYLDDDLECKFDIVDALRAEEAEKYEPLQLLEKAIND